MTRRRLLLGGLGLAGAMLAACRGPATPTSEPAPPSTPAAPAPTAASSAPTAPTPPATATSPAATATAAPRVLVPAAPRDPTVAVPATASPLPRPTQAPQATATVGPPPPSPTPRPTSPPAPTTGPRVPIEKLTKWGMGVYREGNEVFDDLYVSKPSTILLMDPSPGWARRVREWFPKAFVVGRLFRHETAQPLDNPGARGAAFADEVAKLAVPLRNAVDAWMSYNEVVGHNAHEDYRRYNEFQVAFARRLQDVHGIPAVAANDGSGTVEPPDYAAYFADAIRASRYFGLHAYSPLGSHRMRDQADWHALRYRKIHDEIARVGLGDKKFVITESGLGDGWLGRVDDVIMAEEFFWFTEELEKDPYVIGHAAYGLFGGVAGEWRSFELRATDVLTRLGYYEPPSRRTRS